MSDITFLDLLKARIGHKVHVRLKAREYATYLNDVKGDMCLFKLSTTIHYVHYTQVSFYCGQGDCKKLEERAEKINKKEKEIND